MIGRLVSNTVLRKATVAAALTALLVGYAVVWVHVAQEHSESPLGDERCVVCSWAQQLATSGIAVLAVDLDTITGRVFAWSPVSVSPGHLQAPLSIRAPPPSTPTLT